MENLKIRDWRVGVAVAALSAVVLHFTFPLLLFLVFAVVFVVLGAVLALFPAEYSRRTSETFPGPPKPNIEGTLSKVKVYPPPVVRPSLFTASIDARVQEILELTLKHHVIPTYKTVADDEQPFFRSVTPVVWTTLSAITQRASRIDMMRVTQDAVKALRTHFEHFRGCHYQHVHTQFPQLSLYPYLQSPERELNFLRQASEVLLCVSLPKEHLQCTPIRVLIREYLAGQILLPTIEMVCDPDYINQKLLAYLTKREEAVKSASNKYHWRTFEDFVKNIKKIEDLMELHSMRQFIITDIIQAKAVQKMKNMRVKGIGGGGGFPIPIPAEKAKMLMDRDLRVYVTQLETAKTVCERQIRKLGGEDYEAADATQTDKVYESASHAAEKSISLLPFDIVMKNRIAQNFFLDFLAECGYAHLLQFWKEVEKLDADHLDSLHKPVKELLDRYLLPTAEFSLFPEEDVVAKIQSNLEREVLNCLPPLHRVQEEVYGELQENFYASFTCSGYYRDLLQHISGATEGDNSELLELGKFSEAVPRETAVLDPTSEESQYRIKLQTLRMELEETDDMLAAMPENIGTGSLAQRKKALNKDRHHLNDEIKKLEHYIDHTEEWFGTIGKWTVDVHSVDLSAENEKDPLFIIVVHRPQLSPKGKLDEEEEEEKVGEEMVEEGHSDSPEHWALREDRRRRRSVSPLITHSSPGSPLLGGASPHKRRSGSAGSDGDTSYDVVDEAEILRQQQQAGWVVGRRLSDFEQLHSKVVEINPGLQLPPVPKRLNPFHKPDSQSKYWQKYRLALQWYLIKILRDSRLQESEEVFNFLSPASENLRQSSLIHPERKKHPFSLSVPLFSKDEEESTITEHMYALMSEIFELDEWTRMLRKQLMDLVQLTYGKNLHRSVQESINWVVSEPMLGFYLEIFRDSLWPNGSPAPPSPIRSDEQKQQTKYEAKKKFLKSSPQGIQTILGQRNCQIGIQKIFEALQDPRANKQLFYALFELLLYALVPELETVEIEDAVADWKVEL